MGPVFGHGQLRLYLLAVLSQNHRDDLERPAETPFAHAPIHRGDAG